MSLNCLACHILQRSDSDRDLGSCKDSNFTDKFVTIGLDKMMRTKSSLPVARLVNKSRHRRLYSADGVIYGDMDEPRLARSSGIRRDWSFEDLQKLREKKVEMTHETIKE